MARRDALLRLQKNLLARKERLMRKLADELAHLQDRTSAGDSADLAFEADGGEISFRLAEFDDKELKRIERALARWQQGMYGICAGGSRNCQKNIPVARLNALPYASLCIQCEREREKHLGGQAPADTDSWEQLADAHEPMREERINLSALERDFSSSERH
jgi:DnaK suppressor protein